MANFNIPENPEFNVGLRQLESSDPGHADLFNTIFARLLENEAALFGESNPIVNAKTVEGKSATEVGASGARNLIPYPYEKTTSTYSGITWTDNGDGTFTANGTTESTSLFNSKPFELEAGTYRLSGSPLMHNTGSSVNGGITLRYADTGSGIGNYDVGFGSTITLTQKTTVVIRLVVQSVFGEANNLTFRPMLELGSVAHDFVPYHFGGAEDAKTLDGHGAEYFAPLEAVAKLGHKFTIVDSVADMNTVPVYTAGIVYVTAQNIPSDMNDGFGGYGLFYTVGHSNAYQIQRIVCPKTIHERIINNNVPGEWETLATTADLANYLPLTGGTATNFAVGNDSTLGCSGFAFKNNDGSVGGRLGLYDGELFKYNAAASEYYKLLHTGNLANYAAEVEEGTFDLTFAPSSDSNTYVLSGYKYLKIGKLVCLYGEATWTYSNVIYNQSQNPYACGSVSGIPFIISQNAQKGSLFSFTKAGATVPTSPQASNFDGNFVSYHGTNGLFYIKNGISINQNEKLVLFAIYVTD